MIGAAYALVASVCWAVSNTLIKSVVARIDALSLSALRLCVATVFLLALVALTGAGAELVNTPWLSLVYVIISGIAAQAIGDTVYIKSLSYLNVSQAFPIAQCAYPLATMLLAVSLLGEPFNWVTGLGTFLVLLGIYLITYTRKAPATDHTAGRMGGRGIVMALAAGIVWAASATVLKLGVTGMNPLAAGAVRMSSGTIALLPLTLSQRKKGAWQLKKYGARSVALALASGLVDYGAGMVLFIMAMQLIGAGRTVVLAASSPIFLLPFSVFILKEKLTRFTLAGILAGVAGICLVTI